MSPLIKQILTLDKNNPYKYKIVNKHEKFVGKRYPNLLDPVSKKICDNWE